MNKKRQREIREWLRKDPTLKELCERFPEQWRLVEASFRAAPLVREVPGELANQSRQDEKCALETAIRYHGRESHAKKWGGADLNQELARKVRGRMAQMAVRYHALSTAAGVREGVVRFNWFNGLLVRLLFFEDHLRRKPVSLFWHRMLWPLVWQGQRLMPLAEPKGIYCFYSRELIGALKTIIGERSCLEVAAGDGTLSRFLQDAGVKITATDSGAWGDRITFPRSVKRRDARSALKHYTPEVVLCSWPPAHNDFEQQVFKTRSVQTYIVISSEIRAAAGNWVAYSNQSFFTMVHDKDLSGMVLPRDLSPAVYIFSRQSNR